MTQTGAQKQKILALDSDQKTILLAFACTLSLTLLGGVIFQSTMALFVLFPVCLLISSAIFRRRNKSMFNGALHIVQNGKIFTARDRKIYRVLIFISFFLSPFASVFLVDLWSGNNAGLGMFLIIFFPYLNSTIYCFIRKVPLSTFMESRFRNDWSPSGIKSPTDVEPNFLSYSPNSNGINNPLGFFLNQNSSNFNRNDW